MKVLRALTVAIVTLCFALPTSYTVYAESDAYLYGRADVTNAYFCSEADLTTALFTIPYTYCVRIISEDGMWYYASYAEDSGEYRTLYGYVLQNRITLLDEKPETVWLRYTITVTYSQGASGNLPTLSDITASAAFYGNYYSGASGYSYVLCQGSFGYIVGATEDYDLVEAPSSEEDETPEDNSSTANSKVIAIIVFGVIAVAAAAVAFLSGRKNKRRRQSDG